MHGAKIKINIYDFFWGEMFKGFEVLLFSMSATTTQLLSSGEFCKLRYDIIPVKSAIANVSFYTDNPKMPNFLVVAPLSQMREYDTSYAF